MANWWGDDDTDTATSPVFGKTPVNVGGLFDTSATDGFLNPGGNTSGDLDWGQLGLDKDGKYTGNFTGQTGNKGFSLSDITDALKSGQIVQKGTEIFNKVGQLIGDLKKDGTLADIVGGYLANNQLKGNQELQNKLQGQATDALTELAKQVSQLQDPNLLQYVQGIQKAVSQGNISPAQAVAAIQDPSKYGGIKVPAEYNAAVNDTLSRLGDVSREGYTIVERAATNKILGQMSNKNRGEQEAIKSDLASRGQYGSGQELAARMLATQANANLASQQGLDIEAAAAKRALDALSQQGAMGLQAGQQSFNQQATVAGAQDAINKFNAEMKQQMAGQNAQFQQQAGMQDKANQMAIQQQNIAQDNLQRQQQLAAAQQQYQNQLNKNQLQGQLTSQSAGNAAQMWQQPWKLAQLQEQNRNQTLQNALTPGVTTKPGAPQGGQVAPSGTDKVVNDLNNVGKVVDTGSKLWNIGNKVWDFFSDERVKDNKDDLSDDDISRILDGLSPISFDYSKKAVRRGAPEGKVIGITAQQLEATPAKGMVHESGGVKKIDGDKAISMALAALSSLNNRINDLEGK